MTGIGKPGADSVMAGFDAGNNRPRFQTTHACRDKSHTLDTCGRFWASKCPIFWAISGVQITERSLIPRDGVFSEGEFLRDASADHQNAVNPHYECAASASPQDGKSISDGGQTEASVHEASKNRKLNGCCFSGSCPRVVTAGSHE